MAVVGPGVDESRAMAMSRTMMMAIRDNYLQGPQDRARVYEALNALAMAAAVTILRLRRGLLPGSLRPGLKS